MMSSAHPPHLRGGFAFYRCRICHICRLRFASAASSDRHDCRCGKGSYFADHLFLVRQPLVLVSLGYLDGTSSLRSEGVRLCYAALRST